MTPDLEVRQHNYFTLARVDHSEIERNIIYALLTMLKKDNSGSGTYTVPVSYLEELSQTKIKSGRLKLAAEKLQKPIIVHEIEGEEFTSIVFFPYVEYKNRQLTIEIHEKAKPYFFNIIENTTRYYVEEALQIRSKYGKRIYELIMSYKRKGSLTIAIDDLRDMLKTPKSFNVWANFRKDVLDISLSEINRITNLNLKYTPVKKGRRVDELIFEFNVVEHSKPEVPTEEESNDILTGEAKGFYNEEELAQLTAYFSFVPDAQKSLTYWGTIAFKDYVQRIGDIKNRALFNREFTQGFLNTHFGTHFKFVKKESFRFDFDMYKPKR